MSSKRSSNSSKNKSHSRMRDVSSTYLRQKLSLIEPRLDIKNFLAVPVIKQVDNARVLHKFAGVLAKHGMESIEMDELDQLQQDLEKLLCINALRTRFFIGDYMHSVHRHANSHHGKKTSLKRKRSDDRSKHKETKSTSKVVKKESTRSYSDNRKEISKISLPRNDNSDKFWVSIEPYCAPITKDDLAFLEELIKEFSKGVDNRIPEIGEHYALTWSEDLINDEINTGKLSKRHDQKKNGLHAIIETFGNPYTQRLVAALINDGPIKTTNSIAKRIENGAKINKIKASDFSKLKHHSGPKPGSCLDKKLLKELFDQGILSLDDMHKSTNHEDELLMEIKKCHQELGTVNEYNLEELNKLRTAVMNDLHCNQLKSDLQKVDFEILRLYNTIMTTRKKAHQDDNKDYDKIFSVSTIREFQRKSNALLRQQHVLNREINSITDMSMLY